MITVLNNILLYIFIHCVVLLNHVQAALMYIYHIGGLMSLSGALVLCVCRADQGRLLDYIVSWGNLTEEKVALYLRDILEALHYLHSWRIAHLDLKVSHKGCDM